MAFYVYILQSQSTTRYYVGQTQGIDDRLAYHNANYSKSLKNRGPWQLVYTEKYETRAEAVRSRTLHSEACGFVFYIACR